MEEKDQKSLTVGDILDQLIKPSITQGPSSQTPQPRPAASPPSVPSSKDSSGNFKLPQLGKEASQGLPPLAGYSGKESGQGSLPPKPSSIKLSIRTMASDLAKIKGDLVGETEIQKTLIPDRAWETKEAVLPEIPDQPSFIQEESPVRPPLPSRPLALPEIPRLPKISLPSLGEKPEILPERPAHIHEEIRIADKDGLPPFPGAPIPKKKVAKSQDERVEYGAIARVVSSGMTTGVIFTIVVAVAVYFILSLFVFKEEEIIQITPTSTPTEETPTPQVNELDTIFRSISATILTVPANPGEVVSALRSFTESQVLATREFKRVNVVLSTDQNKANPNFLEVLSGLGVKYPAELKNYVKENNLILLYGQEELFDQTKQGKNEKRLVLVTEVSDVNRTMEIVRIWEETMAADFKDLLGLDLSKPATATFLDNERQGAKIRYKNFPLPDKSIDYSIVTSLTGRRYLIITNSRESMYSPADRIRGL